MPDEWCGEDAPPMRPMRDGPSAAALTAERGLDRERTG